MTKTRTVDNTNRPAQPEPGEDEAMQQPRIREEAAHEIRGGREAAEQAKDEERDRQTGE
ncbi:MAG TPA: hypothetical protein VEK57_07160 [Thermoanaerobaculia bacterium]|nr:hypothetical protein [Thermoanaerobaculia bacterium]